MEPLLPTETESEEQAEVLDSLPLGAMFFGDPERLASVMPWPIKEWSHHYPEWSKPNILAREKLGDCYAMMTDTILTLEPPFPGDHLYCVLDLRPELRFHVRQEKGTRNYLVNDRWTGTRTVIEKDLLENPDFDVSYWYAEQRTRKLGLTDVITHHRCMGDAISIVSTKLLMDGIASSYPCTDYSLEPEYRFHLQPGRQLDEYVIQDRDLELETAIPKLWLEDPDFDLVSWYRRYLSQHGFFEQKYCSTHIELSPKGGVLDPVQEQEKGYNEPVPSSRSEQETGWGSSPDLITVESSLNELDPEEIFEERSEEGADFDDLPDLDPLTDDSDADNEDGETMSSHPTYNQENDSILIDRVQKILTQCQPFPGDGQPVDPSFKKGEARFVVERQDRGLFCIYDRVQGFDTHIHVSRLRWGSFSIGEWFAERSATNSSLRETGTWAHSWLLSRKWDDTIMGIDLGSSHQNNLGEDKRTDAKETIEISGIQVDKNKYPALQRNAAQVKGNQRILPKPIVVRATVNGHPVQALLDSGSLGDFMSTTLADQLGVKKVLLDTPLALQLAVQGSRSRVNAMATVQFKYQDIDEPHTFDVINLNNYDLILGTPWMHQHQICIGFNPARVVVGSDEAQPLKVGSDTKLMIHSLTPEEQRIDEARGELRQYAEPLCKEIIDTGLPPLQDINHTIPLIDENKTYQWRPSRCPEIFRSLWADKRNDYIQTGRWKITSARNTVPMMLIPKPGTNPPQLRTVVDLRERNQNTQKLTSPLPDMEGMLRRTASKPFRTALDLKNAYEKIRIIPEHVERSAVTTPDGNMVSLVIQQGDCNAPATYQVLMNHIFSAYIGRFMDIYLNDIVIYSDCLEDHVKHVKIVLDILKREKLYLSQSKLRFIVPELKLLGRIVDNQGIRMDTEKVDSVLNWKVPTNRDLLRGFIGSVGYLADDIPNV